MRATLFDHLTPPSAPPRLRLRERRHACGWYRRKVKGFKYQVRWWLQGYGSVNCGLYDEEASEMVYRGLLAESARHPATPLGLWQALAAVLGRLKKKGLTIPSVLPMYVRPTPGGYAARVKKRGRVVECPGPYPTPAAAHLAILDELGRGLTPAGRAAPAGRRWLTLLDVA